MIKLILLSAFLYAQYEPPAAPNPYGWNIPENEDVIRELPARRTVFDRCDVIGFLSRHHRMPPPKERLTSAETMERGLLAACFRQAPR